MKKRKEWGDGNTLIGAALRFNVRIHVLSAMNSSGIFTIEVPESFGREFMPTADIYIALIGDFHYLSTRALPLLLRPFAAGPPHCVTHSRCTCRITCRATR